MMESTARQLESTSTKKNNSVRRAIELNNKSVPFSKLEKVLVVAAGIVVMFMMISLISLRQNCATSVRQSQNMTNKVEAVTSDNNDLNQQISELSSSSRLLNIAKHQNFSLQAGNVRNVAK